MRERPILFSGPMVRAILEGRKTQTRRVIKPQPREEEILGCPGLVWKNKHWAVADKPGFITPFGQPGDRLWVKETFTWGRITAADDGEPFVDQCVGDNDFIPKEYCLSNDIGIDEVLWKPSLFMPRHLSRILLEVVSVRVERVQEISQEDIESEGIQFVDGYLNELCKWRDSVDGIRATRSKFCQQLWDSINAKRGFGWDKNPWVWVIEFKKPPHLADTSSMGKTNMLKAEWPWTLKKDWCGDFEKSSACK